MKTVSYLLALFLVSPFAHAENGLQLTLSPQISPVFLNKSADTEAHAVSVPSLEAYVTVLGDGKSLDAMIAYAKTLSNTPYRRSGINVVSGFDCSGFVSHVFQRTLGVSLPHHARDIWSEGEKVEIANLQPGDLVFYNTMRRKLSHVGIYIGNGQFIHSASRGGVRVDNLNTAYWKPRWNGARRLAAASKATTAALTTIASKS